MKSYIIKYDGQWLRIKHEGTLPHTLIWYSDVVIEVGEASHKIVKDKERLAEHVILGQLKAAAVPGALWMRRLWTHNPNPVTGAENAELIFASSDQLVVFARHGTTETVYILEQMEKQFGPPHDPQAIKLIGEARADAVKLREAEKAYDLAEEESIRSINALRRYSLGLKPF